MFSRLTAIPNRALLYDVYQYTWDAKEATMLLDSYIAWLGEIILSLSLPSPPPLLSLPHSLSLSHTEAGGSEVNPEHEPFIPRGGFVAEMQVCDKYACVLCDGEGHTHKNTT